MSSLVVALYLHCYTEFSVHCCLLTHCHYMGLYGTILCPIDIVTTSSHQVINWRASISRSDGVTKLLQGGSAKFSSRVWKVMVLISLLPRLSWMLLHLCKPKQNGTWQSYCISEFWQKFKLVFLCKIMCCLVFDETRMLDKFLIIHASPYQQSMQQMLLLKIFFILIIRIYFILLSIAKIYQFALCHLLVLGTYHHCVENTFPLWYVCIIYTHFFQMWDVCVYT